MCNPTAHASVLSPRIFLSISCCGYERAIAEVFPEFINNTNSDLSTQFAHNKELWVNLNSLVGSIIYPHVKMYCVLSNFLDQEQHKDQSAVFFLH